MPNHAHIGYICNWLLEENWVKFRDNLARHPDQEKNVSLNIEQKLYISNGKSLHDRRILPKTKIL